MDTEIDPNSYLQFDLDLSKPLYEQILKQICYTIARGEIALNTKLPSVRELAQQLKVNPNTVMRAYQELDRAGLTETRRGQGTFITSSPHVVGNVRRDLAADAAKAFISSMKELGVGLDEIQELIKEEWS